MKDFLPQTFQEIFIFTFTTNLFRYIFIAGFAFIFYYLILKNRISYKKIQLKFPKNEDYRREIFYSLLTFLLFGLVGASLFNPYVLPYTNTYFDINKYGWGYFIGSFFLTLLIHDTYFYWTHRLMHHPKLFKIFHLVHHQSTNPSPWTSFSFHPFEGFIEAGIFIVFAFTLPLHPFIMLAFLLFMTSYNVMGHLGWEIYPKNFQRNWLGKWLNNCTAHDMHHHYFKNNYGLYFTIWDRLMNTLDSNYEAAFDEIKNRNLEK